MDKSSKILAFAVLTAFLAVGCGQVAEQAEKMDKRTTVEKLSGDAVPDIPSTRPDDKGIEQGVQLYKENCASCHQPLISTTKKDSSAESIKVAIETLDAMKSLSNLSDREIGLIAAVLATPPDVVKGGDEPEVTDGKALWDINCAACHDSIENTDKHNRSVASIKAAIEAIPVMFGLKLMSDKKLKAIETALQKDDGGNPPPLELDGSILYARHCESCHNPLETSHKLNRTSEVIQNAIDNQNQMKPLAFLKPAQIDAIVNVLKDDSPPNNEPEDPYAAGTVLYEAHCQSCHGSAATSSKRGRNASAISGAISSTLDMKFLSFLTGDQIDKIALVLNTSKSNVPVKARVASRLFLESRFSQIFRPTDNAGAQNYLANRIRLYLTSNISSFGYSCSRYDDTCIGGTAVQAVSIAAPNDPLPNPMRRGYLGNLCRDLLVNEALLNRILSWRSMNPAVAPVASDVPKLIHIFRPVWDIPGSVLSAFENLRTAPAMTSKSTRDQWRFLILPICKSTAMEAL